MTDSSTPQSHARGSVGRASMGSASATGRLARVQNLPPADATRTVEAYFERFAWERPALDPERLNAEDFLRSL